MQSKEQIAILTVGRTHSGKTTFGRQLAEVLPRPLLVETDTIELFLKANYPPLYSDLKDPDQRQMRGRLKLSLLHDIATAGLESKCNIILTNSNLQKQQRSETINKIRKFGAFVAIVYLNVPVEILLARIRSANRSTAVLTSSANYEELLMRKQYQDLLEPPTLEEADTIFEIGDDQITETIDKIINLIK